jgi:hypothetical protein
MMEVILSAETPVVTRATWRYIPEDGTFLVELIVSFISEICCG